MSGGPPALPWPLGVPSALVGMIHLAALPGAPRYGGDLAAVVAQAAEEARLLAAAGFDALMVENFHDTPFPKGTSAPETLAALTRCALAVRAAAPELPLGINVLRNDARGALGVAVAVGAAFIRVNVLAGAVITDQGLIEGDAYGLLRARRALSAHEGPGAVAIWADVDVKHAAPLAPQGPAQAARDTAWRGHADALIASGAGTGAPTDPARVAALRAAVPDRPVVVGSGATPATLAALGADAVIVGTALKGAGGGLDPAACAAMVAAARALRGS
jgi:membrane complex biogenesis BtpA family protein